MIVLFLTAAAACVAVRGAGAGEGAVSGRGPSAGACALRAAVPLNAMFFTPAAMMQDYSWVIRRWEEKSGCPVEIRFYRDGGEIIEGLRRGTVDVSAGDPVFYLAARKAAGVEPVVRIEVNGRASLRAAVFVRKDSPVRALSDLRGRTFAYADARSYVGYLFADSALRDAGAGGLKSAGKLLKCETYGSALYAVMLRQADAMSASEDTLEVEPYRSAFRAIHFSPLFPYPPLFVRNGLDAGRKRDILRTALDVGRSAAWRNVTSPLGEVRVVPARDEDYAGFRKALAETGFRL